MSMQVAETILSQLGGNRFIAMTGAYSFTGSKDCLSFRLPSNNSKKIGGVRINLKDDDTYTLTTVKLKRRKGGFLDTECKEFPNVYCDNLRQVFESATGLLTSL